MTTQLYLYFDTSTYNLNSRSEAYSGADYAIYLRRAWQPEIARRQRAGNLPFADTVERIPLMIEADSADNALKGLDELYGLLDSAHEMDLHGQYRDPVYLSVVPDGASSSNGGFARIIQYDDPPLGLTPRFSKHIQAFQIEITLTVKHRPWIGADTETVNSTTVTNGQMGTATLTGSPSFGRLLLDIEVARVSGAMYTSQNTVLLVGAALELAHIMPHDGSWLGGDGFSSVAEASYGAEDSNLLRFTPADTDFYPIDIDDSSNGVESPLDPDARRFHVFLKLRSSTANADWQFKLESGTYAFGGAHSRITNVLGADITQPTVVYLGQVAADISEDAAFTIHVAGSTTSGSPYLDINEGAILVADSETARAIKIGADGTTYSLASYHVRHGMIEKSPGPVQYELSSAGNPVFAAPFRGNPLLLSPGGSVNVCLLSTVGSYWKQSTSTPTTVRATVTARRLLATPGSAL